ncbi:MAG: hypothetical protein EA399_10925 [Desulfovibrionales bacterium]|nr:MAG: hypothetical protein EA399_10925 [Desulfovibrionales bacterium]
MMIWAKAGARPAPAGRDYADDHLEPYANVPTGSEPSPFFLASENFVVIFYTVCVILSEKNTLLPGKIKTANSNYLSLLGLSLWNGFC